MIVLTAGCSFTQYKWPTWANYLKEWSTKKQPHQVINVGDAGIDNSIIAYRVTDYLCGRMPLGQFEYEHDPKDVKKVCVMWTGYERYCPQHKDIVTHTDIKYVGEHFDPYERLRNLALCIDTVNLLCQSKNIECHSFFYFELSTQEKQYLNHMTAEPWMLNYTSFSVFRSNNTPVYTNDSHPTPLDQWKFANEIVAPQIGLVKNIFEHIDWKQGRIPEFVKEHERVVRDEEDTEIFTDYAHSERPHHIIEHMDPFKPIGKKREDEFQIMSIDSNLTSMGRTKSALHDMHDPKDRFAEQNWLNNLINRIRKF